MSTDKQAKINQLLKILPHGVAITSLWLTRQGYSLDLQKRYRKSGWLESIGTGAMKRSGEKLTLAGGIYALQKQLNLSVHPGGKTALSMQGSSHYLQFSTSKTHLFGPARQTLPKWFKDYAWESPILYHTNNLFSSDVGMAEVQLQSFEIKVSNSARALMECLYLYPESQDLSECLEIMESLNNLRPDTVSTLLESCSSVKVNRLFVYLAEKTGHNWFKYLKLENVDFGKGKRSLAKQGVYIPKYQITVPKEFARNG